MAILGALAGPSCQVITSLSPMGWSLSFFELATKYVSSPWPFQLAAVDIFGLSGARLEESFWQSWVLLLVPHAKLSLV